MFEVTGKLLIILLQVDVSCSLIVFITKTKGYATTRQKKNYENNS